jgi:pSer/pThr/pTyr-binding forkhead associated (FHA) protein
MTTAHESDGETEAASQEQLQAAPKTVKVDTSNLQPESKPLTGNALVQNQTTVRLGLVGTAIVLTVHLANRLTMGRRELEDSNPVDIDLMPYGGREQGVSRQHATLYRTRHTLSLVDLNSTNGTYLNGERLISHEPRLLRDGDEICLGNMRFQVHFTEIDDQASATSSQFRE